MTDRDDHRQQSDGVDEAILAFLILIGVGSIVLWVGIIVNEVVRFIF